MFGFLPDAASVAMDDALDQGQPDARALEFILTVQALEDAKELVGIVGIEPDAIVLYVICVFRPVGADADLNAGRLPVPGEFDRVGEKVDKDLAQEGMIATRRGEGVQVKFGRGFGLPGSEFLEDRLG